MYSCSGGDEGARSAEATAGAACDSEALQIFREFECIYRGRIADVDGNPDVSEARRNELKLKIMTDWVKDLGEQNTMLVQTVHDLEQAAVCRVKLLENKLQETSNLISYDMTHADKSEKNLNILSSRICELECTQNEMEKKITNLQSDIDSLLELIKRGRTENNWNLDDFQFCEIDPSDIPVSVDCICGQERGDAESTRNPYFNIQTEDILKLHKHQYELEDKITNLQSELKDKDEKILKKNNLINQYKSEITKLRDSLRTGLNNKSNAQYQPNTTTVHANDNSCIAIGIDNGERRYVKRNLENENLREQLYNTEAKMDKLVHEYKSKVNELQINIQEHCKENRKLSARLACLEKEHLESRDALTQEVAKEHDIIVALKQQIEELETQLKESEQALQFKDSVIQEFRSASLKKEKTPATATAKKVRVSFDGYYDHLREETEEKSIEDNKLCNYTQQLKELRSLLASKDKDISKLKAALKEKSDQAINNMGNLLQQMSLENQNEIISFLTNLLTEFEKENETIHILKIEYETVLKKLTQVSNMYKEDVATVTDRLADIELCLHKYETEVLQNNLCKDNAKDILTDIKRKIVFVHKMFQLECEKCANENIRLILKDSISKLHSGIQTLSNILENKNEVASTMRISLTKKNVCNNNLSEKEQEAILAVMKKQFRMMEEFRICTVEVKAATEDLRDEVSEVISNLNSRHCKYVELSNTVSQVQDYLTRTRENISEVINRLELQNDERARHSERLQNNKIKLKDIKNDFNQTQSELSKCLNNVQNNIQQCNLLGYTEIYKCNDLLVSVVDEVDQIVDNLNSFQSPGCCSLSTMTDLKKQLIFMAENVKGLKNKTDQVLLEDKAARETFKENFKCLEKYESQIDNSHSKMQDVLESIIATTEQINQFGCLKESDDPYQSTNEIIKMKDDLRKSHKECEELRLKLNEGSQANSQDKSLSEGIYKINDFEDQINVLTNEIKCKDESNNILKRNIDILEKELHSTRIKAEEYRKRSSTECLELKKKIFILENLLKTQQDQKNNVTSLTNNETDTKKSQILDNVNNSRLFDNNFMCGLQGTLENMPQLFKTVQDTIQAVKSGLMELNEEFLKVILKNQPYKCASNESVRAATAILSKYDERIKYCLGEVEKIQSAFYSQNKLLENQSQIIKIQKDSIALSQTEVGELNKTLQEKIEAQEKAISQCEREKMNLDEQIQQQAQTIGHLQAAVVEAKKTIDQLSNKAMSDSVNKNKIIRSLNLYLTECQSQYTDCFGEASEQAALLELQRDAISTLQKRIKFLECDELLNAFMLHFIYYVIVYKYQRELETRTEATKVMKNQIENLVATKSYYEQQCDDLRLQCDKASKDIENERNEFEIREKILAEKQTEIDALLRENNDLKKQLQALKVDFNLIKEEMQKMELPDQSIERFKEELEDMRLKNEYLKCELDKQNKLISSLRHNNMCKDNHLEVLNSELTETKSAMCQKEQELQNLRCELTRSIQNADEFAANIDHMAHVIEGQQTKIASLKQTVNCLRQLKTEYEKLQCDYRILESQRDLCENKLETENCELMHELSDARRQIQEGKERIANLQKRIKSLGQQTGADNPQTHYSETAINKQLATAAQKNEELEDMVAKLKTTIEENKKELVSKNNALSEIQAKLNQLRTKFENSERSCHRFKEEMSVMEKSLKIQKIKTQNCKEKNEELIRQNKSLEESHNKCMEELEDIVRQLEDMQSSLVELRNECDSKTQSLECVSVELEKMKVSRSEVCEESKYVLQWVRRWMRQQKMIAKVLQDKLYEKQHRLLAISSEKKKFMVHMKRLSRKCRVLEKRTRLIRKPTIKQVNSYTNGYSLPSKQCQRCSSKNGLSGYYSRTACEEESKAILSVFKSESRKGTNGSKYIVKMQGDSKLIPTLKYISKELPRTSQIKDVIKSEGKAHEEVDNGYHTSGSKSSFS